MICLLALSGAYIAIVFYAEPGFDWYKLRQGWPWVYEAYADLQVETWTKVRIVVRVAQTDSM